MLRPLIAVSWIVVATAALAEPVRLTDDAIRQQLVGSVLEIDTPLKVTIPVRFSGDGLVSGEAGPLALTLGAAKDRGRWWTEHDQLCVKWFRWFDAKARCITLQQDGKRILWQEAGGESGTATIVGSEIAVAAPVLTRADEDQKAVVADAVPVESQISSPPPSEALRASEQPPPFRFAAASLGDVVSSPPPQASGASRVGIGEPPKNESAILQPSETKLPPAKPAPLSASGKRFQTAPRESVASQNAPSPSFRVEGVDAGDRLNVRSGPSEFHAAVGDISPAGHGVQIIGGCRELWCPIRYGRVVGWVNRYYLAEDIRAEMFERSRR